MREVVHLQIGACGNAAGTQFWELLAADHGLNNTGSYVGESDVRLERVNVFFSEKKGFKYTPRSIMIDLDKSSVEAVRSSPIGQIFKPEGFLSGDGGTGNNWAKGHYTEGAELCETSLLAVRKEVEACDYFTGFQIIHSIGGGTGGGLGSLLSNRLRQEYPQNLLSHYSVIPSFQAPTCTVEPYNAILTLSHLIDNSDATFCIDNGALNSITSNSLKKKGPTYCDLNYLIALVMSGVTAGFRFPGQLNTSLRKIAVNMIPFPRLHFFVPSCAPIVSRSNQSYTVSSVAELSDQVFNEKNMFITCHPKQGKFFAVTCLYRGDISTGEVEQHMHNVRNRNSSYFVEWIPDNLKYGVCSVPLPGFNKSATFIGNTTCIQETFKTLREHFLTMFKTKAFLHHYTGEGIEEQEFSTAESNLSEFLVQYEEHEGTKVDEASHST